MKKHAWCVSDVLDKCEALGLVTRVGLDIHVKDDATETAPMSSLKRAAVDREQKKREAKAKAAKDGNVSLIPSKYYNIAAFSVTSFVNEVLPAIHPMTLSAANCKAAGFCGKGNSDAHRRILSEVVECLTGIPPDFPLTGDLRQWRIFKNLLDSQARKHGDRHMKIVLPPNWQPERQGVYNKELVASEPEAKVKLTNQYSGVSIVVPASELPVFRTIDDLRFEMNWSDARAKLFSSLSKDPVDILHLFTVRKILLHWRLPQFRPLRLQQLKMRQQRASLRRQSPGRQQSEERCRQCRCMANNWC